MKSLEIDLETIDDFRSIVLDNRILLDVRASVEYKKGAFPLSSNLPLLDDEQRRLVGICYKEKGNASAVELGQELMGGGVKEQRIQAWKTFIEENPDAYIYCFRGGQRSQISQLWLHELAIDRPRLKGGYKAFRSYLMEEADRISKASKKLILGGRTGSGKTILLKELSNAIDLEGLANHRGSSFGKFTSEQPSQIDFENSLSYALIQHENSKATHLVLEHEGNNIGKIYLPKNIFNNLREAELIILEVPLNQRIDTIFDEYVTQALLEYKLKYKDEAVDKWFDDMNLALQRVKKRLGSELYGELFNLMSEAFEMHKNSGKTDIHKGWIGFLLEKYYDPMYDYQLSQPNMPVVFQGNTKQVKAFIESYS